VWCLVLPSSDLRANNPEIREDRVVRWWAAKPTDVRKNMASIFKTKLTFINCSGGERNNVFPCRFLHIINSKKYDDDSVKIGSIFFRNIS